MSRLRAPSRTLPARARVQGNEEQPAWGPHGTRATADLLRALRSPPAPVQRRTYVGQRPCKQDALGKDGGARREKKEDFPENTLPRMSK